MKMKITKEQRDTIIRRAAVHLKPHGFLCPSLANAIEETLGIWCACNPRGIQKYIPEFKQTTAIKYFNGVPGYVWWNLPKRKENIQRQKFLRYLLTGKLLKRK